MRYYVLVRDDTASIPPYVVAEVVRERYDDGEYRDSSLGADVGVSGATIVTREEMERDPDTRRALEDWERQDDSGFDQKVDRDLAEAAAGSDPGMPATDPDLQIEGALAHARDLEHRAAEALVRARRQGMKIVRHRLAMSEPSDLPSPSLTLHKGGGEDG